MKVWSDPFRRRWLLWLSLVTLYSMVSIYRLSSAVLSDDLMRVFGTTATELGFLHASFFYVYAPFQVVAGVLADRAGPRRTVAAGAVAMNAGAVVFGVSGTYAVAFAARLLIGLGASVIFISVLRFCANWFRPDEFARMSGFTVAASGIGGVLATYPLAVLVEAAGWRSSLVLLGGFGFLVVVVSFGVVRDSPSDAGFRGIDGVPDVPNVTLSEVMSNLGRVLGDRGTWLLGGIFFCATGVNITVFGLWGVPYVVQVYNVSVEHASLYTLLGSAGLVVGPPVIGYVSDRTGRRLSLILASTAFFTAAYSLLAVTAPPLAAVGAVFFTGGFLTGGFVLGLTVVKERHSNTASGTATGTVNAAGFLGAAFFPTLMGAVLDAYWTGETVAGSRVYTLVGYRIAFGIVAAAGVLMVAFSYLIYRESRPA